MLLLNVVLAFVLACAGQADSPELRRVQEMAKQGWKALEAACDAGQRQQAGDKWAATLWRYRQENPPGEAARLATVEALHLLLHAGRIEEVHARAEALAPQDPAWPDLMNVLLEAAAKTGDYGFVIRKAGEVLARIDDKAVRSRVRYALGSAYWRLGRLEEAKSAYQAVIGEAPDSELAKEAQGNIHEITNLGPGRPAPAFTATAIDGSTVSLNGLKGKVVLLDFWASWCEACFGEFPLLKELYSKHMDRGFAVIGVSLDRDREALERAVARAGLPWPQVFDPKGEEGEIARAFHVRGAPVWYLLDRQGAIVSRHVAAEKLPKLVATLLDESRVGLHAEEAGRETSARVPDVFRALGLEPGSWVADIGAGDGFFTVRLAAETGGGGRVFAVEIDKKAVASLRERVKKEGLANVEVVLGKADDPCLPDGKLDAVLIVRTYHEMTEPRAMLDKIRAALKPGGRLILIDWGKRADARTVPRAKQVENHEIAADLVDQELREAGFEVVERQERFVERPGVPGAMWLIAARKP